LWRFCLFLLHCCRLERLDGYIGSDGRRRAILAFGRVPQLAFDRVPQPEPKTEN
jgi:hypothetical protein